MGEVARIEYVALDEVRRWPRNPKLHDRDALGGSIRRFGFVAPLIYDERAGQLVAGHGRLEALQAMRAAGQPAPDRVVERLGPGGAVEAWLVPVVRGVSFSSDAEAEAYLIADNRLVEVGGWDAAELAEMLRAGQASPGGPAPGFTSEELAEILSPPTGSTEPPAPQVELEVDGPAGSGAGLGNGDEPGVEDFSKGRLRAPYPYFGGKYAVAPYVWSRFGEVKQYVEPFCGSAAVLLANPSPANLEVVVDANCYVANFWRALRFGAGALWEWADYPVSHVDQMARHRWLTDPERVRVLRDSLVNDPDWPGDPKVAGWWVWGQCSWIGSGWCAVAPGASGKKPRVDAGVGIQAVGQVPHLSSVGQGLQTPEQKPSIGNAGVGVQRPAIDPKAWLEALSARMARVRVICGSWDRCLNHHYGGDDTAVFLDPPYRGYEAPYGDMACDLDALVAWCIENQHLKVALCGHAGDYDLPGWGQVAWSRRRKTFGGGGSTDREVIWFSPACLPHPVAR